MKSAKGNWNFLSSFNIVFFLASPSYPSLQRHPPPQPQYLPNDVNTRNHMTMTLKTFLIYIYTGKFYLNVFNLIKPVTEFFEFSFVDVNFFSVFLYACSCLK